MKQKSTGKNKRESNQLSEQWKFYLFGVDCRVYTLQYNVTKCNGREKCMKKQETRFSLNFHQRDEHRKWISHLLGYS